MIFQCTRPCDGGVQIRKVTCVGGVRCEDEQPDLEQPCNEHKCTADHENALLNIEDGGTELHNNFLPPDIISHGASSSSTKITSIGHNDTLLPDDNSNLIKDSTADIVQNDVSVSSTVNIGSNHPYRHKYHHHHHSKDSHLKSEPENATAKSENRKLHDQTRTAGSDDTTNRSETPDEQNKNGRESYFIWQTLNWSKVRD